MPVIKIVSKKETKDKWTIIVEVDALSFTVRVGKEYWRSLTDERELPECLVERSFAFLLVREPKDSILRTFDLALIGRYFPKYESEMRRGYKV